jgi:hypothetical protein
LHEIGAPLVGVRRGGRGRGRQQQRAGQRGGGQPGQPGPRPARMSSGIR